MVLAPLSRALIDGVEPGVEPARGESRASRAASRAVGPAASCSGNGVSDVLHAALSSAPELVRTYLLGQAARDAVSESCLEADDRVVPIPEGYLCHLQREQKLWRRIFRLRLGADEHVESRSTAL
jgi:hypothetical protein